jgi:hypothetical protein
MSDDQIRLAIVAAIIVLALADWAMGELTYRRKP